MAGGLCRYGPLTCKHKRVCSLRRIKKKLLFLLGIFVNDNQLETLFSWVPSCTPPPCPASQPTQVIPISPKNEKTQNKEFSSNLFFDVISKNIREPSRETPNHKQNWSIAVPHTIKYRLSDLAISLLFPKELKAGTWRSICVTCVYGGDIHGSHTYQKHLPVSIQVTTNATCY